MAHSHLCHTVEVGHTDLSEVGHGCLKWVCHYWQVGGRKLDSHVVPVVEHLAVAQGDVEEEQESGVAQEGQVDEGEMDPEVEVDPAEVVVDLVVAHSLELVVEGLEEVARVEADQKAVLETELVVVDDHHD